jgi:hypothetical protein
MRSPKARLSTRSRSPSRIVGFIDPVGTVIQFAHAERKTNRSARKSRSCR